jgi:hypothetical protein
MATHNSCDINDGFLVIVFATDRPRIGSYKLPMGRDETKIVGLRRQAINARTGELKIKTAKRKPLWNTKQLSRVAPYWHF